MRKLRRISLFLLLGGLLVAGDAFAQRTGGRLGGRSGFRTSSTPARTLSSPGGSGGGGGFFFFPMPFFGGYGFGGGSLITVLFLVGFLYFFLWRPRAQRTEDDGYQGLASAPRGKPNLYSLDVALRSTAARDLQRRLQEIGANERTDTPEGLSRLLRDTTLALLRRRDEIAGAAIASKEKLSMADAERLFEAQATQRRSRYEVDVFSADGGKVRTADAPEGTGREGILEYLVVSFVVASHGALAVPKGALTPKELEDFLSQLGSIPGSQLLAMEVIWTPGDPNDSLTNDQLAVAFPELQTF